MQSIEQLLNMMAALRDSGHGCPWDREQDFTSIAPYTIEEAYEVADVIERNDLDELCTELGDLLFQVVYHAQMARERSLFEFADVVDAIINKIEKRHPHVFADAVIGSVEEQRRAWEEHKRRERDAAARADTGLLQGIPAAMPALSRAQKLQQRAANAGFDWEDMTGVLDKIREELQELTDAVDHAGSDAVAEEMGDLLFSCVNLSRHLGLDAEAALRAANRKFERRFGHMEKQLEAAGHSFHETDMDQLEAMWQEAKSRG